jgi:hypothetical protein
MKEDGDGSDVINDEVLWLAACLAHESIRPDRLLADPFAAHLAGPRGARMFVERPPDGIALTAAVSVAVVDDVIQHVVLDHHLHTIVQLCAGLDTRPFRLVLPNDLRWVELDCDALILYKAFRLAHASPMCRVERVSFDVTDPAEPGTVLRCALRGVARGLLVMENALEKFDARKLADLAAGLRRGIKWWILSTSTAMTGGPELIADICDSRWRVADYRPLDREARRLAPERIPARLSDSAVRQADNSGAVWLLRRVG